jgi:uncharacterized protein YceH (UPF0502 family)
MEEQTRGKSAGPWEPLDPEERRVLGVLAEKAKTTPDAYPLSLNALVTGCNQKSNRDPVMNLTDLDVEDALARCQKRLLAVRVQASGRVIRWRHNLYDAWDLEKVELAVLAELLLRGPQTEGELRGRASRMEPIEDLDALRAVLRPLVERKLVIYLTPEDRRGAVLTHGFHEPGELQRLRAQMNAPGREADRPPTPTPLPAQDRRVSELEAGLAEARGEIAGLQNAVAELREEIRKLKQELGG